MDMSRYNRLCAVLLIAVLLVPVLSVVVPAAVAQQAVQREWIVSSSKFYGTTEYPAGVRVELIDSSKAGDGTSWENITVAWKRYRGGMLVASGTNFNLTEIGNTGRFEGFLTNKTWDWTPANPEVPSPKTKINKLELNKGDVVQLTYTVGATSVTTSITFDTTAAVVTLDRSTYPPANNTKIYLTVDDQDLNRDPTAAENATSANTAKIQVQHIDGTTGVVTPPTTPSDLTKWSLVETDVNSHVFKATITIKDILDTLRSLSSVKNGDVIKIYYVDRVGGENISKSFAISAAVGSLSVPASITYSQDLIVWLTDPDANLDSQSKDTVTIILTSTGTSPYDNEILTLSETGPNTGIFTGKIPVTFIGSANPQTNNKIELTPDRKIKVIYSDNYPRVDVQQLVSIVTTPATIAFEKSTYLPTATAKLILTDPDLNDDPTTIEFYTAPITSRQLISNINVAREGTNIGQITILVNGLPANATSSFTISFRESSENSTTLTATLPLSNIGDKTGAALKVGDVVQIIYKDLLDNTVSSASFTVSAAAFSVSLDRTQYPIANQTITVYVTVEDPDANTSPTVIETITIGDNSKEGEEIKVYNATGGVVSSYASLTLTETGPNTGVFTASFTLDQTVYPKPGDWINAQLKVVYYSPTAGKTATATATFVNSDISLALSQTTAKYGDKVTVTVTYPDANLDSRRKDSFTIKYDYTNLQGTLVTGQTLTLTETDVNTGVFTGSVTIGDTFSPKPGTKVTFKATDNTPITTTPSMPVWLPAKTVSAEATILTHTGVLTVTATEIGPGSQFKITLKDPDLNTNIYAADTATVRVRSTSDPTGITVTLLETGANTGIFEKTVTAKLTAPSTADSIYASVGDTIQVVYLDAADATGAAASTIWSIKVVSVDPTISFDKAFYKVGETATIVVEDLDANADPTAINMITVVVTSTSDPIGVSLTLAETDVNTGVFKGSVLLTSDPTVPGALFVKDGDKVTASYKDEYPADYPVTGKAKTFTATVTVGVPPVVGTQTFGKPAATVGTLEGVAKTTFTPTETVALSTTIKNNAGTSITYTWILQIKDAQGRVVFLSFQSGTIAPGATATPGMGIVPKLVGLPAGTYTAEIFVWDNFANANPLSETTAVTFTVTG
jgi:hypothetical protein